MNMGVSAVVKDGKIVDTRASSMSDSTQKKSASSSLDKEAFLQLLVAQMQYQDPLEPMDNTEYVSQLATFSELEAMNNLNDSMSLSRASQLVGKNVLMRTTSSTTGETYMTQGVVDYVVYENGKAYLSIKESLYSLDDLDTIISDEYWENYQKNNSINNSNSDKTDVKKATEVVSLIAKLPESTSVKESDEKKIKEARAAYDALSEEDKGLISNDALYRLIKAEAALTKLLASKQQDADTSSKTDTESGDDAGVEPTE